MSLDIRIPIGLMFAIVGAILLVFGLVILQFRDYTRSQWESISISGPASHR